jgi:hypothetical protein
MNVSRTIHIGYGEFKIIQGELIRWIACGDTVKAIVKLDSGAVMVCDADCLHINLEE